jgi:transposase InsO family protein
MILEWVGEAHAAGLSQARAGAVLDVLPRTLQRWRERAHAGAISVPPSATPAGMPGPTPSASGASAPDGDAGGAAPGAPDALLATRAPNVAEPEGDAASTALSCAPAQQDAPTAQVAEHSAPVPPAEQPAKQAEIGPQRPRPYNALRLNEAALVVALIRSRAHADESVRDLSLSLLNGPAKLYVSPVTFWLYQRLLGCNGPRGRQTTQGRARNAPDTDWVTGPNMLWDWDITYLATAERGVFLYLYSVLDHFSRKNLAWLISQQLAAAEAQRLWDKALVNEGLLDRAQDTWPKSLSDRGAPMRAHTTAQYFHRLGIAQLFSRPQRPNDNPYIESHFATVKTHPAYPGFFDDQPGAEHYFAELYPWYNDVHPHTRLHMLTPGQVHSGQGPRLLQERAALKAATLAARCAPSGARPFTLEELIADLVHLPDVSQYPCYSWAGPNAPAKPATPLD